MPTATIETALLVEHHSYGEGFTRTFVQRYEYDRSIKIRRGTPHERRDRLQMTSQRLVTQLYGFPDDHAPGICADTNLSSLAESFSGSMNGHSPRSIGLPVSASMSSRFTSARRVTCSRPKRSR